MYNVEKYLNRCVQSLLKQTMPNIEIILVDDGSLDNCPTICDDFSKKDPRVVVIHQRNSGVSAARNTGIECAKGRFILFCDGDDWVAPQWCEMLCNTIREYPESFICCGFLRVDESFLKDEECRTSRSGGVRDTTYYSLYKSGFAGACWNKVYSKEIIEKYRLRFDTNTVVGEDVIFETQYCSYCNQIKVIEDKLYYYVQRGGSALKQYYPERLGMRIETFKYRVPLILEEEINDFCDGYLFQFIELFENIFDKRNKMIFFKKMQYNQKMVKTAAMQYCVNHVSGSKESSIVIWALRKNYYVYWLVDVVRKIKIMLKKRR